MLICTFTTRDVLSNSEILNGTLCMKLRITVDFAVHYAVLGLEHKVPVKSTCSLASRNRYTSLMKRSAS